MSESKRILKQTGIVVAIFAIVGVGLGSTGYVGVSFAGDQLITAGDSAGFGEAFVALIFLQSVFVSFFAGPSIAAVTGVASALSADAKTAIASNTIGACIGFIIMSAVAVLIMSAGMPEMGGSSGGGSSGGNLFSLRDIATILKAALPTTIVGAGAAAIATLSR